MRKLFRLFILCLMLCSFSGCGKYYSQNRVVLKTDNDVLTSQQFRDLINNFKVELSDEGQQRFKDDIDYLISQSEKLAEMFSVGPFKNTKDPYYSINNYLKRFDFCDKGTKVLVGEKQNQKILVVKAPKRFYVFEHYQGPYGPDIGLNLEQDTVDISSY